MQLMTDRFHESVFRYIARIAESLSGQKSDKFQKFPTLCLYHSLSTTQSFGLISLRRGIEWGIHCAIYRGGGVLANCSGLRDTLGLKRAKPA